MKNVYVVSDLHMFCSRSQWEEHLEAIEEAAARAELFVFNGDTFDFKWSTMPSLEDTVDAAIEYLADLCGRYEHCQFHLNLGNHDHIEPFITQLDLLADDTENLSWHRYYLRVGSTVFLHGDVAQRKMNHSDLVRFRNRWSGHKPQSKIKHRVYDAATQAKAHVPLSRMIYPAGRTLRLIAAYLDDIGLTKEEGIKRVYFGHTHVPIEGKTYKGITFHNGGAPLPGVDFNLLKAVV